MSLEVVLNEPLGLPIGFPLVPSITDTSPDLASPTVVLYYLTFTLLKTTPLLLVSVE